MKFDQKVLGALPPDSAARAAESAASAAKSAVNEQAIIDVLRLICTVGR